MWNYLQGENRLRTTCIGVTPIDYRAYNKHLLTKIKELTGIDYANSV